MSSFITAVQDKDSHILSRFDRKYTSSFSITKINDVSDSAVFLAVYRAICANAAAANSGKEPKK